MGVEYYQVCLDCKVYVDLDKGFIPVDFNIKNRDLYNSELWLYAEEILLYDSHKSKVIAQLLLRNYFNVEHEGHPVYIRTWDDMNTLLTANENWREIFTKVEYGY